MRCGVESTSKTGRVGSRMERCSNLGSNLVVTGEICDGRRQRTMAHGGKNIKEDGVLGVSVQLAYAVAALFLGSCWDTWHWCCSLKLRVLLNSITKNWILGMHNLQIIIKS